MKKSLLFLFAVIVLLTLSACGGGAASSKSPELPEKADESADISELPDVSSTEDINTDNTPAPSQSPASEASKYYDLFQADPGLITLLGLLEDAGSGFTDDQLSAYAITMLAVEGRYDYETGVTQDEMNAVTQKYFGQSIQNFENSMTTILDNGKVTATGWSFDSSAFLVLDGEPENHDGVITACFKCYQLSDSVWLDQEIEQYKLDHIKDYLLAGDDEDFPEPQLVKIVFEECFDEVSRNPYVFYHNIALA